MNQRILAFGLDFDASVAITEAHRVAIAFRDATLTEYGSDAPEELVGHVDGKFSRGHKHVHWLPVDSEGDGRIQTMLVYAPAGLSARSLEALSNVNRLYLSDLGGITVNVQAIGDVLPMRGRHWITQTPFVPTRYPRQREGVLIEGYDVQVCRELRERGLPDAGVKVLGLTRGWHGKNYWPKTHALIELAFPEEIEGIITLGRGSHLGLGLFVPV